VSMTNKYTDRQKQQNAHKLKYFILDKFNAIALRFCRLMGTPELSQFTMKDVWDQNPMNGEIPHKTARKSTMPPPLRRIDMLVYTINEIEVYKTGTLLCAIPSEHPGLRNVAIRCRSKSRPLIDTVAKQPV